MTEERGAALWTAAFALLALAWLVAGAPRRRWARVAGRAYAVAMVGMASLYTAAQGAGGARAVATVWLLGGVLAVTWGLLRGAWRDLRGW